MKMCGIQTYLRDQRDGMLVPFSVAILLAVIVWYPLSANACQPSCCTWTVGRCACNPECDSVTNCPAAGDFCNPLMCDTDPYSATYYQCIADCRPSLEVVVDRPLYLGWGAYVDIILYPGARLLYDDPDHDWNDETIYVGVTHADEDTSNRSDVYLNSYWPDTHIYFGGGNLTFRPDDYVAECGDGGEGCQEGCYKKRFYVIPHTRFPGNPPNMAISIRATACLTSGEEISARYDGTVNLQSLTLDTPSTVLMSQYSTGSVILQPPVPSDEANFYDTPDKYGFVVAIYCKDCEGTDACDVSETFDGKVALWDADCFDEVCGGVPSCAMCDSCVHTNVMFYPNPNFPPNGDASQTDVEEFLIGGEKLTNPNENVIVKAIPNVGGYVFLYIFGSGECDYVVKAEELVSVAEGITWSLKDPSEMYDLPGYAQMNRDYDEESVYLDGFVADNIGFCDDGEPCHPYASDFAALDLVDTPEETDNKLIMKTTFARAERLARECQYKINHSYDCGSGGTTNIAIWDEQAPGNYIFVKRNEWIDIDLPSNKRFFIEGLAQTCNSAGCIISFKTKPLDSGEPGADHDCVLEHNVEPNALVRVVKVDLAIDSDGDGNLDNDLDWGNGVNTDEFIEENVADDDTQGIEKARAFVGLNDDWDEGRLGTGGLPELDNEGTEYIDLSSDEDLDYMQFRLNGLCGPGHVW